MKDDFKLLVGIIMLVMLSFYVGAMFNFFPFIADDLVIRTIWFCALIISIVIAICTIFIHSKISKNK